MIRNDSTEWEKLAALAKHLGFDWGVEAIRGFQKREQWILDARAWLEERAERDAIEAQDSPYLGIFRKISS